jgi:hypothetical protein
MVEQKILRNIHLVSYPTVAGPYCYADGVKSLPPWGTAAG